MSIWSRVKNVFRGESLRGELDEEMQAHIEEAIENGRDPEEARRAFGSLLRRREDSQDIKLAVWMESLRSDAVFGLRQLLKNKTVSAAAVLSLALAIGACTAAFRLIDAMLLRPLPVSNPERLYYVEFEFKDRQGKVVLNDSLEYPFFRVLREAVKDQAELIAISYASRIDITYGSNQEMEKTYRQYVSGWTFGAFGLKPAAGRLLTSSDDVKPGGHPYAVLSYDYWSRRFGQDPKVVGRTFKIGLNTYEIVGVCEKGFTGTETGTMTDLFVPTMMNAKAINEVNWSWFRGWVKLNPGAPVEQVRQKLSAAKTSFRREKVKTWGPGASNEEKERYINEPVLLEPAFAGASSMQRDYRRPLTVLALVVALVLLIACANVANLMTAQATARAKEMALRVSIGAGRLRLLQLVMVESALIAAAATVLGGLLAWWAAPFVVTMINSPDQPARLLLPADWRVLGFASALALGVAILFGMIPALRASTVKPIVVLRGGGSNSAHSRHRVIHMLTALQVAFCFLVLFLSGLFLTTFERVAHQPTGFQAARLLTLETGSTTEQPFEYWMQSAEHLRSIGGVESASFSSWALMSDNAWTTQVWMNGQPVREDLPTYFLGISPGWLETMRIPMIDGREFRPDDLDPQAAIVNEAFAKRFFDGQNPVGRTFELMQEKTLKSVRVVGYVRDVRYTSMREEFRPTVFLPFHRLTPKGEIAKSDWATFIVRTANQNPLTMAAQLRREVPRARSEFLVSDVNTQEQLVQSHLVKERLLAVLSLFFAVVALLLAGVGLFGVLQYSMIQRRREIGIRMALGARATAVARKVTAESFAMLLIGAVAGLGAGAYSAQWLETLLFQVKASDPVMLAAPAAVLALVALAAAVPPVIQAVRIDPASMLRSE